MNSRIVGPCDARDLAEAILESLDPITLSVFSHKAVKTEEKFSWKRMVEIACGELAAEEGNIN